MTRTFRTAAVVLMTTLALTGCAAGAPEPTPTAGGSEESGPCEQVSIVVDFGVLDEPAVNACGEAGVALESLAAAGITTEGTEDYGDQVVCRVNDQPAPDEPVTIEGQEPFVEACQTLNATAYWAVWVKTAADSEWEYAQEGVNTLQLDDGQSLGLVYTPGTDSTPPRD